MLLPKSFFNGLVLARAEGMMMGVLRIFRLLTWAGIIAAP